MFIGSMSKIADNSLFFAVTQHTLVRSQHWGTGDEIASHTGEIMYTPCGDTIITENLIEPIAVGQEWGKNLWF
jgi:hypothetical protein